MLRISVFKAKHNSSAGNSFDNLWSARHFLQTGELQKNSIPLIFKASKIFGKNHSWKLLENLPLLDYKKRQLGDQKYWNYFSLQHKDGLSSRWWYPFLNASLSGLYHSCFSWPKELCFFYFPKYSFSVNVRSTFCLIYCTAIFWERISDTP